MITSILRIKNIFIYNKCCSSCFRSVTTEIKATANVINFWKQHMQQVYYKRMRIEFPRPGNSHSYLPYCSVLPKYIVHFFGSYLVWKITYVQYPVDFWRKSHLKPNTHASNVRLQITGITSPQNIDT